MKQYISRLKDGCPKGMFALWWIMRLLMLFAFISSLSKADCDITDTVDIGLGLAATFWWEACMAAPKSTFLPFMHHSMQTLTTVMLFLSCFCGRYLNFTYSLSWFDPLLQFIFGGASVFFGYEVAWAIVKKQKSSATKAMMFYVAFGIGYFAMNLLELYEFTFDHIVGLITGLPGDAQHWSYALAEGTAREFSFLPAVDIKRWPLMDTMSDIVLGTVSAFIALLILNIYPYRHKGRFKYYTDFEAITVAAILPKEGGSIKKLFNAYIERLRDNCPKSVYIFWWVIRFSMIGLAIKAFITEPKGSIIPLEILMNLACMFIWEICMLMPPKNVFRYVPHVLQTLVTVCDFIAVIAGYLFNFYYEVRLWDSMLHFLAGVIGVYFGYEITCALFKMERRKASLALMIIASTGFCFMATTFWEIFEFSSDQLVGMMSGSPSDVQHWSYDLALGTPKIRTLIDCIDLGRWPLMDTMIDIVLNTIGALLATLGLVIYPYRNKGRFRFNFDFDEKETLST